MDKPDIWIFLLSVLFQYLCNLEWSTQVLLGIPSMIYWYLEKLDKFDNLIVI